MTLKNCAVFTLSTQRVINDHPYYLTGKEENVAHPSRVIKRIVQVQCGISCVAAVLSHCRVLADKTKGYLTGRVIHLTCWNINLKQKWVAFIIDVFIVNKSHKWATIRWSAGSQAQKKANTRHMRNNTPAIRRSQTSMAFIKRIMIHCADTG